MEGLKKGNNRNRNSSFMLNDRLEGGNLLYKNAKEFLGILLLSWFVFSCLNDYFQWEVAWQTALVMLFSVMAGYHCLFICGGFFRWMARGISLFSFFAALFADPVREQCFVFLGRMSKRTAYWGIGGSIMETAPVKENWALVCLLAFFMVFTVVMTEIGKKAAWLSAGLSGLFLIFMMAFLGAVPDKSQLLLLMAGWICLMAPSLPGALIAVLPCAAAALVFGLSGAWAGEESPVQKSVEKWRFHNDAEILPEGKMSGASEAERDDTTAFKITMEKKSPYYLRGYIAMTYGGNAWSNDEASLNRLQAGMAVGETGDLFALLRDRETNGRNLLAAAAGKRESGDENVSETNRLRIRNIGADRRYLYLPYECITSPVWYEKKGEALWGYGENLYGRGIRGISDYFCDAYPCLAGYGDKEAKKGALDETGQNEEQSLYEKTVKHICLSLPRNVREQIGEITKEENRKAAAVSSHAAIKIVQQWLKRHIVYDKDPGEIPENTDFVQWFFAEQQRGCDVHYAAAAVMLFRYYGIPARYVEGYVIAPENLENVSAGESVLVPQANAHAWPEIYIDERGWIPVEVTEEYESRMGFSYLQEPVEKIQSGQETEKDSGKEEEQETISEQRTQRREQTVPEGQETSDRGKSTASGGGISGIRKRFFFFGGFIFLAFLLLCLRWMGNARRQRLWKESADHGYCIRMWYRELEQIIRMLEQKKTGTAEDNRTKNFVRALKKWDGDLSADELVNSLRIRQKAVYGSEGLTGEERNRAAAFFEQEEKRLWKKLPLLRKCALKLRRSGKNGVL